MNAKQRQLAINLLNELLELVGNNGSEGISGGVESNGITYRTGGKTIDLDPQDVAMAILLRLPGIPSEELAKMVGVHKSTLYRWSEVGRILRARKDYKRDRYSR